MSRTKLDVLKNEEYMNNVALTAFINRVAAVKRKNNSIWSLNPNDAFSVLMDSFPKRKQETRMELVNPVIVEPDKSVMPPSKLDDKHDEKKNNRHHRTIRMPWKSMTSIESDISKEQKPPQTSKTVNEQKKYTGENKLNKNDYETTRSKVSNKTSTVSNSNSVKNDFQEWCLKRREHHENSPTKVHHPHKNKSSSVQNLSKLNDTEKARSDRVNIPKKSNHTKHAIPSVTPSEFIPFSKQAKSVQKEGCNSHVAAKYLSNQKRIPRAESHSSKESHSPMVNSANTESMLRIKITWEDACHEIMTDHSSFLRMKKSFPKLSEIIPSVDTMKREVHFSADAMKVIMGFLFTSCYRFDKVTNGKVGVEILAAAQSLEVAKLQSLFQNYFLANILSENNVSDIYSISDQFGLKEICDACKNFANNSNSLTATTAKFVPKKCFIAVSTYKEALEYCIPLDSVMKDFTDNFNKSIENDIIFEAISGCFTITGVQIQLNVEACSEIRNSPKLQIFYSAENITENIAIKEQTSYKPLRPTIIIYFNEELVINEKQKGRISIYTDIKPYLCPTFKNEIIRERSRNGKFRLTMESNFKVQNSNRKRFFIGKLFYHVKQSSC